MRLSIHHTRGKSDNPDYTNLGYGWMNIETTWPEAFELITVDGLATSAELTSDNRREANFASRQLLMVDVDGGMTIPDLLDDAFYTEYGAGFYATHSFKPEHHKFRICFILEQAETNAGRLRKIIRGLLQVYPAGDEACKDPVRLFYGNPNCELKHRTDRLLTNDIVEQLIAIVEEQDRASAEAMTHYTGPVPVLNDAQKQRILDLLKQTYVGSYPIWRNVGWGLKAGGFGLTDFQYVTGGMMSQKTPSDAATVWTHSGQVSKPITMGSVIHLLRERHGRDCLREATPVNRFFDTTQRLKEKYDLV